MKAIRQNNEGTLWSFEFETPLAAGIESFARLDGQVWELYERIPFLFRLDTEQQLLHFWHRPPAEDDDLHGYTSTLGGDIEMPHATDDIHGTVGGLEAYLREIAGT